MGATLYSTTTRPRPSVALPERGQRQSAGEPRPGIPGPGLTTSTRISGALLPKGHQLANKGIALAIADGISSSSVSQLASQTAVGSFLEDYYATSEAWSVRQAAERVLSPPPTRGCIPGRWAATGASGKGPGLCVHLLRADPQRGATCTCCMWAFRNLPAARPGAGTAHRVTGAHVVHRVVSGPGAGRGNCYVGIDYRGWGGPGGRGVSPLATDGAYTHLEPTTSTPPSAAIRTIWTPPHPDLVSALPPRLHRRH